MFDTINRVRIYEAALKKLATGRYDDKDTYVHDYDDKCYRTDPNYTLNGLHWGYPDGIVRAVTKEDPEGASCFDYATWVTARLKKHSQYGENDRFKVVKYRKIKKIVELGIQQKLDQARKDAAYEKDLLIRWQAEVKDKFAKFANRSLRIQAGKKAGTMDFTAINPERFKTRGFGNFLENIKKGEISISRKALDTLSRVPERRGLMNMEIFAGPIVAGLFIAPQFLAVPVPTISVSPKGFEQLRKLVTVQD